MLPEDSFIEFGRLMAANRSIRRFDPAVKVTPETLRALVGLTRYCASGRNLQPLRYRMVSTPEECAALFPHLLWAGYYQDWDGPAEGERPAAYLVQCLDTRLAQDCLCDDGLQLEAITLGARTLGLGSCIIKAFNAPEAAKALHLPEYMKPRYILALGAPAEQVEIVGTDGSLEADIRYYRTPDGTHHVPKRPLDELLID
ncbi:MAG: nitroreductase family protein [Muribaculaceae bacterium]|nr:nitroreductase family protein [Muribaculaceae bacterium]